MSQILSFSIYMGSIGFFSFTIQQSQSQKPVDSKDLNLVFASGSSNALAADKENTRQNMLGIITMVNSEIVLS